jgi:ATP-binding cassette subfamily C (CFTR/MRP) protein 1
LGGDVHAKVEVRTKYPRASYAEENRYASDAETFSLPADTSRTSGLAQALAQFMWSTTPFLVSCLIFTTSVLTQDKPLTTDIIFPALALFHLLAFPLALLPTVITSIVDARIAMDRITSFLTSDELQTDAVSRETLPAGTGGISVAMTDGEFMWNRKEPGATVLRNINFVVSQGQLVCVVGRVGAGKSSLLGAILGDLWKSKGQVMVRGSVAYVAQQTWLMNAYVKKNILFGHPFESDFYQRTVRACALLVDFESFPDGDETEVGEKGISLSGGQRARIALARAVYARAYVYFLDDPLSAVDQHVGRHLIENVLGANGLLAKTTRVLATNSIPILVKSDRIILLNRGEIAESGSYAEMASAQRGIYNIIKCVGDTGDNNSVGDSYVGEGSSAISETIQASLHSNHRANHLQSLQGHKERRTSVSTVGKARAVVIPTFSRNNADEETGNQIKKDLRNFREGEG